MLSLNTIPPDSHAAFTRFENTRISDKGGDLDNRHVVPVHHVKEWVYPRNDNAPVYKTVRVSEHKWPLKTTYLTRYGSADMWPEPPQWWGRDELIGLGAITPAHYYNPDTGEQPVLALDNVARDSVYRDQCNGAGLNGGLPSDYLTFWQESMDLASEM